MKTKAIPLRLKKYKAVLKNVSGNIYLVNPEDKYNDFYAYSGDPKKIDFNKLYCFDELTISGSFAKINDKQNESTNDKVEDVYYLKANF